MTFGQALASPKLGITGVSPMHGLVSGRMYVKKWPFEKANDIDFGSGLF